MQARFKLLSDWASRISSTTEDSEAERIQKTTSLLVQIFGYFIALMYLGVFLVYDMRLQATFQLSALLILPLLTFLSVRRKEMDQFSPLVILFLSLAHHTTMGGFFNSGFVMIWTISIPLFAALFVPRREALVTTGIFVLIIFALVFLEPRISQLFPPAPYSVRLINVGKIGPFPSCAPKGMSEGAI